MKGVGSKKTQFYYNYFYNGSNGGLSIDPFTVKYSTMYKSKGTWLKLYYKNLFGVDLDGAAGGDWYGDTWYILEYDY
jgi:hypothetical protein